MKTEQEVHPPMPPDDLAIVAAFLDGEPVESAALKQALATAEGREYLVDLLALRHQVAESEATVALVREQRIDRSFRRRVVVAAAAAVLAASMGGYVLGDRTNAAAAPSSGSPVAVVDLSAVPQAPQPTRVVQLRLVASESDGQGE
jgi:hypothetical protein